LTIRAERRPEFQEEHNVLVAERPQGSFTRQLQLGESLDSEDVQADYSDGVLRLTIPVAQAAQPRRITVGQGGGEGSGGQPRVVEGSRQKSAAGEPSKSE
ncbi:MAG: Hsp20/alpha crystallin family protein, partial [Frankiaceae bacterium]